MTRRPPRSTRTDTLFPSTTLFRSVWVLDRPNPAGRPVEGTLLQPGWESFVGAGPMVMRHGLTMGEMGHWFIRHFNLDVDYRVIGMAGWEPKRSEERRVGKECVSTGRSRWAPSH